MTGDMLGRRIWAIGAALLLSACATTGVNPTGLTGGQVKCVEGPRESLDCRGALQQFARDFKADLSFMGKAQIGLGITSNKLTEADALSSDLIQHYYQTCTLYNACIISRQDYAAKMEKVQDIQLQVRRALVGGGFGAAQNIQINPPFGAPPPGGGFPQPGGFPPPPGGFPPPPGAFPQSGGGFPPPSGAYPPGGFPPPAGGGPSVSYPPPSGSFPPGDPYHQQAGAGYPLPPGQPYPGQPPAYPGQIPPGGQGAAPGLSVNIPPPSQGPQDRMDTILNLLREGSKVLREQTPPAPTPPYPGTSFPALPATTASMPAPPMGGAGGMGAPITAMAQPWAAPAPAPAPQEDLDSRLRAMLASLKQQVASKNPSRAAGQAVVGNFTEEGQPWSSPLGALLQERVATLVETERLFNPAPAVLTRGITIKQVAAVENPNDPKALGALYNAELAIAGTYRPQTDWVLVRLTALDEKGGELAQVSNEISTRAIPDVVAAAPANAADTSQLLNSFNQLGPRSQGDARVEVTTNRPGAGASFRLGEEIRYFVTSTIDGYLYLFHIDADKNVLRISPNQYQREGKIRAGTALEVPAPGAPFKFEASPPFGLETTFAIVTSVPLDEKDFQLVEGGFSKPKQEISALVGTRGISVKPAEQAASASASPSHAAAPGLQPQLVWNSVTVLIRP
jgi:hypothetical protein